MGNSQARAGGHIEARDGQSQLSSSLVGVPSLSESLVELV